MYLTQFLTQRRGALVVLEVNANSSAAVSGDMLARKRSA